MKYISATRHGHVIRHASLSVGGRAVCYVRLRPLRCQGHGGHGHALTDTLQAKPHVCFDTLWLTIRWSLIFSDFPEITFENLNLYKNPYISETSAIHYSILDKA